MQAGILDGSVEQLDVFNVFEAALIRGVAAGPQASQNERTGRRQAAASPDVPAP